MFWADRISEKIIKSGKHKPYWVDDMKTPSGRIHVGSLRGVVLHDLIYKTLVEQSMKANFTYVFEDHDPMDELPAYLEEKEWSKYLGQPLFTIPSPDGRSKNYAQYFANEFKQVFNKINCHPKIIWASDLYLTGKMNEFIRLCLDKADVIRAIYEEVYDRQMPRNWYPFNPVCPKCGKESTTEVTDWDGEKVSFKCKIDAVNWTKGCGYDGRMVPFSRKGKFTGKLPYKIDWPVKWKVIGITIEGAGKDHMTAGGSHDVSSRVCERVLNYPIPYAFSYEFFLIDGKKMSSSKGLGTSAKEISQTLPAELLRFLIVRAKVNQPIDFDPRGWAIPNLFDEYDRCWRAYMTGSDKNLARIFELSQVEEKALSAEIYLPRFRTLTQIIQFPNVEPFDYFCEEKGEKLTSVERSILQNRIKYAKIWLEQYASEEAKFVAKKEFPLEAEQLSDKQREYLKMLIPLIDEIKSAEKLQRKLYETAKNMDISVKKAFAAIYLAFLGKPYGPKAAWFLLSLDKEFVKKRLKKF